MGQEAVLPALAVLVPKSPVGALELVRSWHSSLALGKVYPLNLTTHKTHKDETKKEDTMLMSMVKFSSVR